MHLGKIKIEHVKICCDRLNQIQDILVKTPRKKRVKQRFFEAVLKRRVNCAQDFYRSRKLNGVSGIFRINQINFMPLFNQIENKTPCIILSGSFLARWKGCNEQYFHKIPQFFYNLIFFHQVTCRKTQAKHSCKKPMASKKQRIHAVQKATEETNKVKRVVFIDSFFSISNIIIPPYRKKNLFIVE